jgi:outer membrane protein
MNFRSLTRLAGCFALAAGLLAAPAARAETLAETLVSAFNNSGLIDQNRATLRAADESVAQAVAALRPVIDWSAQIQNSFGKRRTATNGPVLDIQGTTASLSLSAGLTIYDAGANRLRVDIQKETVLATRSQLVQAEQEVLFRAVAAFMEVRRAEQNVSLRQNNVRVIRQELRAARDRFEVGEVTRTDVSLAEARLSAAQSALAGGLGQLESARAEFIAAVGRRPGQLSPPTTLPNIPPTIEAAQAHALRNHPSLQSLRHQVTAAELAILVAKAAVKPTVTLRGGLSVQEGLGNNTFSHSGSVSLEAGGPIYRGGALRSAIRESMANRDSARAGLHITTLSIEQEVSNAYVQLKVAQASRAAFEDQVRASRIAFQGVREEATLGQRTTLDVLDAEQELLDARANLVSAQVDETIAAYRVLAAIGDLTSGRLQLDVPKYDPVAYYNMVRTAPAASRQGDQLDRVLRALGQN